MESEVSVCCGNAARSWNDGINTWYDRGGMRRVHLRGRENILKRLVVHSGAANLGLLMRKLFGKGTPRRPAGTLSQAVFRCGTLLPRSDVRRVARPYVHLLAGDPADCSKGFDRGVKMAHFTSRC